MPFTMPTRSPATFGRAIISRPPCLAIRSASNGKLDTGSSPMSSKRSPARFRPFRSASRRWKTSSSTAPATSSGANRAIPLQATRKTKRKEEVNRDSRAFSGSGSGSPGRCSLDLPQRHDFSFSALSHRRRPLHDLDPAHGIILFPAERLLGGARQRHHRLRAEEKEHPRPGGSTRG